MIKVEIPGYKELHIRHLVLDYNGTLAVDGKLIDGVKEALGRLSDELEIHVLTADTFGTAHSGLAGIDCKISTLELEEQDIGKLEYVEQLGAKHTVCIGNGRNDRLMLREASIGIAVLQEEGAAFETLQASDMICSSIVSALALFSNPLRLVASLRS